MKIVLHLNNAICIVIHLVSMNRHNELSQSINIVAQDGKDQDQWGKFDKFILQA